MLPTVGRKEILSGRWQRLKGEEGPAPGWICTWTVKEMWGAARGLLPQATICCPSWCCWGLEAGSQWVWVLTPWVPRRARLPPPCTEGHVGDTEEVRLKVRSGEEGGDRGAVPRFITMPCTPCDPTLFPAWWGWLDHGVSPFQLFQCCRNAPKEECEAEVGIHTEPRVKLYNCS